MRVDVKAVKSLKTEWKKSKKLWQCHALGLADLGIAERSKSCEINMAVWRRPANPDMDQEVCEVCFAGSVMRRRFPEVTGVEVSPGHFPANDHRKFSALNHLREGYLRSAIQAMGFDIPKPEQPKITDEKFVIAEVSVEYDWDYWVENCPSYEDDPKAWRKFQHKILAFLKKLDI